MHGLTLDQVKALCIARRQAGWSLAAVLDEVEGLYTTGLADLNGSRPDLDSYLTSLYRGEDFEVVEDASGIHVSCPGESLCVDATRIEVRIGGLVVSELHFVAPETKTRPAVSLHQARVNLLSTNERTYLLRALESRRRDIDWQFILSRVYDEVIGRARRGGDGATIGIGPAPEPLVDLLSPFLPEGEPSVFFGQPESGKSYLSLLMALALQLPWPDNPFRWGAPSTKHINCLYLDYESTQKRIDTRLRRLARGHFGDVQVPLEYLPGVLPLCDDVDRVLATVIEKNIGLIVIDSLGGAAGGELNTPESALRFFGAVRRLGVTTAIIAHTSKDTMNKDKTIFGSQFFTAYARSVWECIRTDTGLVPNMVETAIINRKLNDGPRREALGLRFRFDGEGDDSVTWAEPSNVIDQPDVIAKGGTSPTRGLLITLYQAGEPMKVADLATAINRNAAFVRSTLSRLKSEKDGALVEEIPSEKNNQEKEWRLTEMGRNRAPQQGV